MRANSLARILLFSVYHFKIDYDKKIFTRNDLCPQLQQRRSRETA